MREYHVVWRFNTDAKSHKDAAERALKAMRDPQSSINDVFDVRTLAGQSKVIDLTDSRTGPRNKS